MDAFFSKSGPDSPLETKRVLLSNSSISEESLEPHVESIRSRAWNLHQYPCIGLWRFLHFNISAAPSYENVLQRLKHGDDQRFLDLASGLGQDIRKLVFDGAPSSSLMALELEKGFVNLGYELFGDKESMKGVFVAGDIFSPNIYADLGGQASFDMIQAACFLHLFSYEEQLQVLTTAVRLLKRKPGCLVFGIQIGSVGEEPHVVESDAFRSGQSYRHSIKSWMRLIRDVEKASNGALHAEYFVWDDAEYKNEAGRLAWRTFRWCISTV